MSLKFLFRTTNIVRCSIHFCKQNNLLSTRGLATWSIPSNNAEELNYFKIGKLADYPVPEKVIKIALNQNPSSKFLEKISRWSLDKTLTRSGKHTYIEAFRTMIYFEELAEQHQIDKFNLKNVKLHFVEQNEFLFFYEPNMESLCVAIENGLVNRFILRSTEGEHEISGTILGKADDKFHVLLFDGIETFSENNLYNVDFQINRISYQMQHKALDFVKQHNLFEMLISNPKYSQIQTDNEVHQCNVNSFESSAVPLTKENLSDLNEEQRQAVEKIVHGKYYPLPYLLYGPAGTGKTKTLIAAVKTIFEMSEKNVLICAQSNAACDEIAERLHKFLDESQLFRMYATSQRADKVPETLKRISNIYDGIIDYPPLKYLYEYRIVVCTLATAGNLTRAQCNPRHFSYVIIDECASSPEPLALVPLAGLCTSKEKVHANIILSGDPKQLDAIAKSEWADKLGYSVSLLEQLFNLPLYQRNDKSGKFNSNYVTQLVKNYRSHPAILTIPNQLFYEGALEAKATPEIINFNIDLQPNPTFPIIFKSIQGACENDENDTSLYNMMEVDAVMEYVNAILKSDSNQIRPSDIGIVSPYKLQCKKIRQACQANNLNDITVGTSEIFQGQERKVIIISTVRSRQRSLGNFVSDPQRLNVILTRAINLLIVVGDPHTLQNDLNWFKFIDYCFKNNGFIQGSQKYFPNRNRSILFKPTEESIQ